MTKLLTIFISFFLLMQATAADRNYLVYHANKEVYLQQNGIKEKAKRGMFVSENHRIIIADQSDVMLIQNDGKSMLLTKPGTYSYLQIKKMFSTAGSTGVSSGFFAYVFEKFLNGNAGDEKQKVSAAVIRGKRAMQWPADSSFLFTLPVVLHWKAEQKNIPYRIIIQINGKKLDTVIRGKTSFSVPANISEKNKAMLLQWTAIPSDSKQKHPDHFLSIIPAEKDNRMLQQQLKQLTTSYSNNPQLMRLMKNDLFERWLEIYQLY